ncbi:hypothetical protein KV102_04605 [Mumia sp. zg.B53]|uniref:DUF6270 domain-containing protein n=1 Tax=Mumia sp. zg.B53 TaxID=2855449 RepID=UPI001C6EB237|nr:DUF6270 domain-containing protein [Mumia sp. zg.B53]MBW9214115.1 hypothetical protein [Mumia sp. zg.B53]
MDRMPRVEPRTVAVFGSCITRDCFNSRFNPGYKDTYRCELLQNQMSLISLMSEPVLEEWQPTRAMSEYDLWNVRTEFSKEFLDRVVRLQPEYLIVDFFGDAHFGCVRLDDGRYVTDNRWKVRHTDLYDRLRVAGRLEQVKGREDPDRYFALWSEALDRFAAFVRDHLPRSKVVVHHGHHTAWLDLPDRTRPVPLRGRHRKERRLHKIDVEAANALWRRMDARAVEVLGAAAIDLTDEVFPTYDEHPWGPFYVHYPTDYYQRFLAELHKIVVADEGVASAQMVGEIERGARATLERDLRARSAQLDEAEERLVARKEEVARLRSRVARLERTPWRRAASRLRRTRAFRARRP